MAIVTRTKIQTSHFVPKHHNAPDPDDPSRWGLTVDIIDAQHPDDLTYTLIHEFAHVLTLNETQVAFDNEIFNQPDDEDLFAEAESSCPTYFPGEGCSLGDSYINAFFDAFWSDIYEEWLESDPESDEFYLAYEDQFVTDYAATNPGEDFAESFTSFVMEPKPDGDTIAEEKVLFFYEYPECAIAGRNRGASLFTVPSLILFVADSRPRQ